MKTLLIIILTAVAMLAISALFVAVAVAQAMSAAFFPTEEDLK